MNKLIPYLTYLPTLKTTDAELRAVQHLPLDVKDNIVPIFELTRSRKTKTSPSGSLFKRVQQLRDVYGDASAIIDLTTEEGLLSPDIDSLFDERDGYASWCRFAQGSLSHNYIPCLQFSEGGSADNFRNQVNALLEVFPKVALRVSVRDLEAAELYESAIDVAGPSRLIVIANTFFVEQGLVSLYEGLCSDFIIRVIGNRFPSLICFPSSGFPRAVGSGQYGNDSEGTFSATERQLFDQLWSRFPSLPLAYADFGSVHPIRYEASFGSWIPRVDIPSSGKYSYSRARRGEGGYVAAARNALSKHSKDLVECWGAEQVRLAADGKPAGVSPSFWISVRVNLWITQQARRLAEVAELL